MHYEYEIVKHIKGLPIKAFFVSIGSREYHWHSDLEIVWILKGSVIIQMNTSDITLNVGDIYLLNTNEVHCLKHTNQDNLLLALQINETIVSSYYKHLNRIHFDHNYIGEHDELSMRLKQKLAKIMIDVMNGSPSDRMKAVGNINLLMADLFSEIPYQIIDMVQIQLKDNNLSRLQRVISFVNDHYEDKISLQTVADLEYLSKYRMSHFIKEKLGINFQTFINRVRFERALTMILETDENILKISENCGFSDIKYLNKLLKEEFGVTATGLRKKNTKQISPKYYIENHGHRTFDLQEAIGILNNYL